MVVVEVFDSENTTFISIHDNELAAVATAAERRNRHVDFMAGDSPSCWSSSGNARDSSTSPRDTLQELRQSHNSILNMTGDDESDDSDDEDEDEEDELFPPQIMEAGSNSSLAPTGACCPSQQQQQQRSSGNNALFGQWLDNSTSSLKNISESFAEGLCSPLQTDPTCGGGIYNPNNNRSNEEVRRAMEQDLMALLACQRNASSEELEVWTVAPLFLCSSTKRRRVPNNNTSKRANRVHRFLRKQNRHLCLPRHRSLDNSMLVSTSTTTSTFLLNHSNETSFRDAFMTSIFGSPTKRRRQHAHDYNHENDDFKYRIGMGIEPIAPISDGYDSDPETFIASTSVLDESTLFEDTPELTSSSLSTSTALPFILGVEDFTICVQETLNHTWNLVWHPTRAAYEAVGKTTTASSFEAVKVSFWMEKGSILGYANTLVVEPQFMFRSNPLAKPHALRMLNVCRVLHPRDIDRTLYPLARTSHSLLLKTVDGFEFLFEASSREERQAIQLRLKLILARLATLAVFEDMESMVEEYFLEPALEGTPLLAFAQA